MFLWMFSPPAHLVVIIPLCMGRTFLRSTLLIIWNKDEDFGSAILNPKKHRGNPTKTKKNKELGASTQKNIDETQKNQKNKSFFQNGHLQVSMDLLPF